MSRERLELVTDFARLRAGMILVCKPCVHCDASAHRFMLMNLVPADGKHGDTIAWTILPHSCKAWRNRRDVWVSPSSVATRTVYRVVDNLDLMDSEELWAEIKSRRPDRERVK